MDLIKEIHQFLKAEIDQMNEVMLERLSVEEELVKIIGQYIAKSGGKRIRPILTLLSAKMLDCKEDNKIKLAAAVEFIHMATLLHDDVVDGSKMRRFIPSANEVWGSKASILVGDFLFSQSFKLIVATHSMQALVILSDASAIIAEGEVAQLAKLEEHRLITEEEYLKIINAKTAELFGAACEVGGIIANGSTDHLYALRSFGIKLGNIFQITDDLLDYFSDSKNIGKNIGEDFAEGKVTLPLIFLARRLSEEQRSKLQELIFSPNKNPEDLGVIVQLLGSYNIKEEIFEYLQNLKKAAYTVLDEIKVENKCKGYLRLLVDFAIERTY